MKPHLRLAQLSVLLLGVMQAGCGTLSNVAPEADVPQKAQRACGESSRRTINQWLPAMVEQQSPAMVVGVIDAQNQRHYWRFGVTDSEHQYPVDEHTLFAVGSLSKGMTAEATAVLVAQGRLHWSDRLENLLPPSVKLSADAKKITLLQLVTHTSGLPRQNMDLPMLSAFIRYLGNGENFYTDLDSDNVVAALADFSAPGRAEPRYSNLGYAVLNYVLHYQTGQRADRLVQRLLFDPLGMRNSSFTPQTLKSYPLRAIGHAGSQPKFIPRGQVVPDWQFSGNMVGAGSLYTDTADLLTFAAAHLDGSGNAAVDQAIQDTLQVYYPRHKEAANIAWVTDTYGEQSITYQVGYIGGYSSYIGIDRVHHFAVVVLQNSFTWQNNLGHSVLRQMVEEQHQAAACHAATAT
ncbi:class A beta-lactamase-related serine hydrolase [Buttiauxella warmboldiae]|uniref:Class A beta-lactamase-related serine hydrolase n=1 Tax=Buttiauxella warmboldiae TaxID=82993 RepID=A0A3N5DIE0_9ENTR|nr:serine hydrolase domain-containing protein [Buttiauxella warmboldiae]RPH28438.1 class A beta-lactamase-related serine hydrolase [Buttiauxella warmboldiae]